MLSNIKVKINNCLSESYNFFVKNLIIGLLICPTCKAKGRLEIHGYYPRHVVALIDTNLVHEILMILRLKCKSCGCTHAVLPDFIIPYCTYSYSLILECLNGYYSKVKIEELCKRFKISPQLIYLWIKRFLDHKAQCILLFKEKKESKVSLIEILKRILGYINLSDFLKEYFYENKYCFMQIINSS
ncbi:DUF6431 domain-containing protein [Methanobrevibacter sp. UBA417]|jgi:transposase-like protein|uniref:DUF6431 domain-containing protein n=1 Tax=Methanobrevibacter sp. UBA417 TaxID=1915487 RepID=UPI0039B9C16E|nr:DUF6431 domain-containing protein [Bacilli bacterium]